MDEWTTAGPSIADGKLLERLRDALEHESDVVVEHRFYRGGRSPHRFVCTDYDFLVRYLAAETKPGDSLYFWSFESCCTDDRVLARGKVPDAAGHTPQGGAY